MKKELVLAKSVATKVINFYNGGSAPELGDERLEMEALKKQLREDAKVNDNIFAGVALFDEGKEGYYTALIYVLDHKTYLSLARKSEKKEFKAYQEKFDGFVYSVYTNKLGGESDEINAMLLQAKIEKFLV